jgi:hypothetical protein
MRIKKSGFSGVADIGKLYLLTPNEDGTLELVEFDPPEPFPYLRGIKFNNLPVPVEDSVAVINYKPPIESIELNHTPVMVEDHVASFDACEMIVVNHKSYYPTVDVGIIELPDMLDPKKVVTSISVNEDDYTPANGHISLPDYPSLPNKWISGIKFNTVDVVVENHIAVINYTAPESGITGVRFNGSVLPVDETNCAYIHFSINSTPVSLFREGEINLGVLMDGNLVDVVEDQDVLDFHSAIQNISYSNFGNVPVDNHVAKFPGLYMNNYRLNPTSDFTSISWTGITRLECKGKELPVLQDYSSHKLSAYIPYPVVQGKDIMWDAQSVPGSFNVFNDFGNLVPRGLRSKDYYGSNRLFPVDTKDGYIDIDFLINGKGPLIDLSFVNIGNVCRFIGRAPSTVLDVDANGVIDVTKISGIAQVDFDPTATDQNWNDFRKTYLPTTAFKDVLHVGDVPFRFISNKADAAQALFYVGPQFTFNKKVYKLVGVANMDMYPGVGQYLWKLVAFYFEGPDQEGPILFKRGDEDGS